MLKKIIATLLTMQALQLQAQDFTKFVDPFLGTGGHGHVYPGATVPFGAVQLSPDNGVEGWDWCSGYHYSSKTIAGFSHTHLSGTGIGDWCDISVLPLNDTLEIRKEKILQSFRHNNESAKPGYYQVKFDNEINCEFTASERSGYHRFTFPQKNGWLRFDMGFHINWDSPTAGLLQIIDAYTIVGYRYSTGWAKGQKVYFAAAFNEPIANSFFIAADSVNGKKANGKNVKLALQFNASSTLNMAVSLSSVGTNQALAELRVAKLQAFDLVKQKAQAAWNTELSKIKISTNDTETATKFYTALYRTCLAPVVHSDRDKYYQTHDGKVKQFNIGQDKYTIFSQWDVFRAQAPLFTITQPNRLADLINSQLQLYADNGLLPVWDISTWEANTMTGYHSVPIIADAILKNIKGFDYKIAYQAMLKSAYQNQRGTQDYIKYGYLPQDKHGWSVTITLEYAFDDWCIAQVAKKLGDKKNYEVFMKRALSYKKLFDAQSGFMRSKDSTGKFIEPFDPLLSEHGFDGQYIEGTAWQHSFFVPHDVTGLAQLYGGNKNLVTKLDQLFDATSELHGKDVSADISGLIGQYAHGNEPSHHIIYMYSVLGAQAKAQLRLKQVVDSLYQLGPDGLSGNDDCGQMSAWYVWTALGMYPMNPTSGQYVFGLPLVKDAKIKLPNGKSLTMKATQKSKTIGERAIEAVLNGKEVNRFYITHQQLLEGGLLELSY